MDKIELTEEKRKEIIDQTNTWIGENNLLAVDILWLTDTVKRIGLLELIIAKPDDRRVYSELKRQLSEKTKKYSDTRHKIEVNEKLLGINRKPKRKIKNKTL